MFFNYNKLKRFEKLENISYGSGIKERTKISKRFERLEIGDKKIEVAITDKGKPSQID